ncbi:tetratricopeptide repeat protein [Flammeovirga agarivorans]|uniref:Tetratricopeptide repeat protein n=1 Tax=Flammeovirga agarivorans TaxID=2726742 RepID=A0A7X8SRC8_9BACT|nr:tetratricopeptide repeat protein [Flammeovirga agarivorans]NLR94995.1 tetratricopeptide repeat protein [Flammeovirga agarivorans]
MGNKQYILIGAGVVMIAILAFLPKAVITDNSEAVAQTTNTSEAEHEHTEGDGHDHSQDANMNMAHDKLPADTQRTLDSLEHAFSTANTNQNKAKVADEAFDILYRMNKFDQAGGWKLALYGQTNNIDDLKEGADAYYEAFTFAMSEQKSASMAKLARENYEDYLKKHGEDLDVKVKIGMTYVVSSSPMQGIMKIREVIAEDPNHRLALSSLGILSMQSGQYDKAVTRFEKLKDLDPNDLESRFYLAMALKQSGKDKAALEEMKYINKNADTEEIRVSSTQYLAEWDN